MDNRMPVATIAIPTYNRADGFLSAALQSAVRQTEADIEILVSDNCSTDHTGDLVRGFGDPRIRYCRHDRNIGPNNNFNYCVEQARGRYFLLLSDDDLVDPDFIESCMTAVGSEAPPGIVRTGTRLIDGTGRLQSEHPNAAAGLPLGDFLMEWFRGRTALYLCSTLFHAERLREIGGFHSPRNLFQDVVAELRLASRWGRVDVPAVKASFRRHGGNFGNVSRIRDWCEDSRHVLDLIGELVPDANRAFRRRGEIFFCEQNYERASRIAKILPRWRAYGMIWRAFGFVRSPCRYWLIRNRQV